MDKATQPRNDIAPSHLGKRFTCPDCGKRLRKKSALEKHRESKHAAPPA